MVQLHVERTIASSPERVFGRHNTPIINFNVPSGRGNEDLDLVAERVIAQGPA